MDKPEVVDLWVEMIDDLYEAGIEQWRYETLMIFLCEGEHFIKAQGARDKPLFAAFAGKAHLVPGESEKPSDAIRKVMVGIIWTLMNYGYPVQPRSYNPLNDERGRVMAKWASKLHELGFKSLSEKDVSELRASIDGHDCTSRPLS